MATNVQQPIRTQIHFPCGRLIMTAGVDELVDEGTLNPTPYLIRHLSCDWGDVCDRDRRANDTAVRNGYRLLSSYQVTPNLKLWIITEWDRSVTTLLLPEEY